MKIVLQILKDWQLVTSAMLPSQVLVPALGSGEALPNVSGRSYVVKVQQSQTIFVWVKKKQWKMALVFQILRNRKGVPSA